MNMENDKKMCALVSAGSRMQINKFLNLLLLDSYTTILQTLVDCVCEFPHLPIRQKHILIKTESFQFLIPLI